MPVLVRTRKSLPETRPHLVVLGSDIHLDAKFKERNADDILEALNNKERWKESCKKDPVERYAVTKLFDLYIANELARLTQSVLGEPAVVVDVVTPSFCTSKSELLSRAAGALFILVVLQALTARTVADGSRTIVHAAVYGPEAHGKYLEHQKITSPGLLATSPEGLRASKRLWDAVTEALGFTAPEAQGIVSSGL